MKKYNGSMMAYLNERTQEPLRQKHPTGAKFR